MQYFDCPCLVDLSSCRFDPVAWALGAELLSFSQWWQWQLQKSRLKFVVALNLFSLELKVERWTLETLYWRPRLQPCARLRNTDPEYLNAHLTELSLAFEHTSQTKEFASSWNPWPGGFLCSSRKNELADTVASGWLTDSRYLFIHLSHLHSLRSSPRKFILSTRSRSLKSRWRGQQPNEDQQSTSPKHINIVNDSTFSLFTSYSHSSNNLRRIPSVASRPTTDL